MSRLGKIVKNKQLKELNSVIKRTSKIVDTLSMELQMVRTSAQEAQLYEIKRQLALATALIEELEEGEDNG